MWPVARLGWGSRWQDLGVPACPHLGAKWWATRASAVPGGGGGAAPILGAIAGCKALWGQLVPGQGIAPSRWFVTP